MHCLNKRVETSGGGGQDQSLNITVTKLQGFVWDFFAGSSFLYRQDTTKNECWIKHLWTCNVRYPEILIGSFTKGTVYLLWSEQGLRSLGSKRFLSSNCAKFRFLDEIARKGFLRRLPWGNWVVLTDFFMAANSNIQLENPFKDQTIRQKVRLYRNTIRNCKGVQGRTI